MTAVIQDNDAWRRRKASKVARLARIAPWMKGPLLESGAIVPALQALLEPTTRGDPQSPLLWTCKSTRDLAEELNRAGPRVNYRTVAALLHGLDYRLQANRKTREGASHPGRRPGGIDRLVGLGLSAGAKSRRHAGKRLEDATAPAAG